MQKLTCKVFEYSATSLDDTLNTPDDSDHNYYMVCDVDNNDIYKHKTEQLSLMPHRSKINDD